MGERETHTRSELSVERQISDMEDTDRMDNHSPFRAVEKGGAAKLATLARDETAGNTYSCCGVLASARDVTCVNLSKVRAGSNLDGPTHRDEPRVMISRMTARKLTHAME
jgi:hypothetical protein